MLPLTAAKSVKSKGACLCLFVMLFTVEWVHHTEIVTVLVCLLLQRIYRKHMELQLDVKNSADQAIMIVHNN